MWLLIALTVYASTNDVHADKLREFDEMSKCSTALMALDNGKGGTTHAKTWYVCLPTNDAAAAQTKQSSITDTTEGRVK